MATKDELKNGEWGNGGSKQEEIKRGSQPLPYSEGPGGLRSTAGPGSETGEAKGFDFPQQRAVVSKLGIRSTGEGEVERSFTSPPVSATQAPNMPETVSHQQMVEDSLRRTNCGN